MRLTTNDFAIGRDDFIVTAIAQFVVFFSAVAIILLIDVVVFIAELLVVLLVSFWIYVRIACLRQQVVRIGRARGWTYQHLMMILIVTRIRLKVVKRMLSRLLFIVIRSCAPRMVLRMLLERRRWRTVVSVPTRVLQTTRANVMVADTQFLDTLDFGSCITATRDLMTSFWLLRHMLTVFHSNKWRILRYTRTWIRSRSRTGCSRCSYISSLSICRCWCHHTIHCFVWRSL